MSVFLPLFDIQKTITNCGTGRNPDYLDLNVNFTITVIKAATILRFFPPFLKPLAIPSMLYIQMAHFRT